jgi:excisionase family DNA binding protein
MKPATADSPFMLTRPEVAKMLRVSEWSIVQMERDKTLTPVRLRPGGSVRHRRQDVEAAVAKLLAV